MRDEGPYPSQAALDLDLDLDLDPDLDLDLDPDSDPDPDPRRAVTRPRKRVEWHALPRVSYRPPPPCLPPDSAPGADPLSPPPAAPPAPDARPLWQEPRPHSPEPLRRPVPRQFLERVARPLLARLLSDHASALEARLAFPLAALAASTQTDRTHVESLWHLLSAPPPELVPLREDLLTVADVATPGCHEALLARDVARVLDEELGAEDCAAIARLDHRPLFDSVRPQAAGQAQAKSFASFQAASPRALPGDRAHAAAFKTQMSKELAARGRSDFFQMHEWRSGTELHMELVFGRLAAARDLLGRTGARETGAGHAVTAQVTDRTTERAHAVFHDDTLRLDVAGQEWMKELVRRVFGEAWFGSAAHFEGNEALTLAPLVDLAATLSVDGVPGLTKVELQELWITLEGTGWIGIGVGARGSCLLGATAPYVTRGLTDGAPSEACLSLWLAGRTRPVKLKLVAPQRLEFDRRDARVVRVVRDWLVARRFLTMPEAPAAQADVEA